MKKSIIIIGMILAVVILLAACGQNKGAASNTESAPAESAPAQAADSASSEVTVPPQAAADTGQNTATPVPDKNVDSSAQDAATPSVTKEELDSLKNDIEGDQFEDLEGLS